MVQDLHMDETSEIPGVASSETVDSFTLKLKNHCSSIVWEMAGEVGLAEREWVTQGHQMSFMTNGTSWAVQALSQCAVVVRVLDYSLGVF